MGRDVGHALAVDVDLAAVAQALDVLGTREGAAFVGNEVLGAHGWFLLRYAMARAANAYTSPTLVGEVY